MFRMAGENKRINPHKFFWNPETKEKIHIEYMDGTKIKLNDGQKKKCEEAKAACTRQALKQIKDNSIKRRKPMSKRNPKSAEDVVAEGAVKKVEAEKNVRK